MKYKVERWNKMKKNKGFTLIELLAVIVILTIVVLIAVPVVNTVIKDAKKKAFINTVHGIIEAGDLYYQHKLMMGEEIMDESFEFPHGVDKLKIKGHLPEKGVMIINVDGNIALSAINEKWCIIKDYNSDDVTINNDTENCYNPAAPKVLAQLVTKDTINSCIKKGEICTNGTQNTKPTMFSIRVNDTETYKFYVMKDDGKEVTLIMDRNLYSAQDLANDTHNVAWINADDYGSTTVTNDKGPLTALATLKERTESWVNIEEKEYIIADDSGNDFYKNIYMKSRARILTDTETENLGCNYNMRYCPSWLYNNLETLGDSNTKGFWLSTAYIYNNNRRLAKVMTADGARFTYGVIYNNTMYGIRPVITLSK